MSESIPNPDQTGELRISFDTFSMHVNKFRSQGDHDTAIDQAVTDLRDIVHGALPNALPLQWDVAVSSELGRLKKIQTGTDDWYRHIKFAPLRILASARHLNINDNYGPDFYQFAVSSALNGDEGHARCVREGVVCPLLREGEGVICPGQNVIWLSSKILDRVIQIRYLSQQPYDIDVNSSCDKAIEVLMRTMVKDVDEHHGPLMYAENVKQHVEKAVRYNHRSIDQFRAQFNLDSED